MNHLVETAENAWQLPQHAHIVVYDREREQYSDTDSPSDSPSDSNTGDDHDHDDDTDTRGLLTIYDCGASQRPPSAQLLGTLESVEVEAVVEPQPTGRIVKLRESATLEERTPDRYRIQ